jgi:hypothetical protein
MPAILVCDIFDDAQPQHDFLRSTKPLMFGGVMSVAKPNNLKRF